MPDVVHFLELRPRSPYSLGSHPGHLPMMPLSTQTEFSFMCNLVSVLSFGQDKVTKMLVESEKSS